MASETHRWDDKTTVLSHARSARAWLLKSMLPLWTSAGFDATTGQFVEALDADGRPLDLPRRALVQARQMVVCCAGGRLGWRGPWAELASAAGDALLARGRNDEGDWIYSFDAAGAPADTRSDLYTQAFVILGFAEAAKALGRARLPRGRRRHSGAAGAGVAGSGGRVPRGRDRAARRPPESAHAPPGGLPRLAHGDAGGRGPRGRSGRSPSSSCADC